MCLALVSAGGALFAGWASAEETPPMNVAAVEGDAGATDAGDGGDAESGPSLPAKQTLTFSQEKTPQPKKADWDREGEPVSFSPGSLVGGCKTQKIHEWVRIRCDGFTAQIAQIGGNPAGVSIALEQVDAESFSPFPASGEIVFPVRPGDRRVFEWLGAEFGYKGSMSATTFLVISEAWLPGDDGPTIYAR